MQGFWVQFCRHFSVIVHSFNWRNASRGPLAIGFYLLAQDGTTGLDVVLHFVLHLLRTFIDALRSTYDGRLICNIYFVMQGFWVLQFNAHFCVIMHGFQLTWRIAWSLGDSGASFHLLIQDWLVWMWFLHVVVRLLRMFIDALFIMTICQQTKVYLVYMDSVCMLT